MSIIERLTSLFAPDDCLRCGQEGSLLCPTCLPHLPVPVGRCFGCQRNIIQGAGCADCLAVAGLHDLHVSADYSEVAKLLVACLKFRGNQSAARIMAQSLVAQTPLHSNALLVNMPATTAHIRERGFDQAELMVRHLSRCTGLPRLNALRRSGQQHQLGAGRVERLRQLSASLTVRSPAVHGRHIILVDDVLTTGSSLRVAASVLLAAGATSVSALVFAQAMPPAHRAVIENPPHH